MIDAAERTPDRYFIVEGKGQSEREVDAQGFIGLERNCGFRPKDGCGPFATGGFSSGDRSGRIESHFDGPAIVHDNDTGDQWPFDGCRDAYDEARARNAGLDRRRFWAMAKRD